MNIDISSMGSVGINSSTIKSHGPIHTSTAGSGKPTLSNNEPFHMDNTPVSLEGRFPSKDKQVFFDENDNDEEKMFEMYDVDDKDFK